MRLGSNGMNPQLDRPSRILWTLRHLAFFFGYLTTSIVLFPLASIAGNLEESLETCIQTITPSQDGTRKEQSISLVDTCPVFYTNWTVSPLNHFLDPHLEQQATLLQLKDLSTFLRTSQRPVEQQAEFDFVGLSNLLARTLIEETLPQPSWWELFLQWLSQKFKDSHPEDFPWLIDFFKWIQPFKWLGTWMIYGIAGLIVLAAALIVGYELRTSYAQTWLRREQRPSSLSPDSPSPTQSVPLSWEEVLALPPNRQPAALLRLVIASFKQKEKLPSNESLTNKEFLEHLRKFAFPQIDHFQALVLMTESVIYGDQPIDQAELDRLILTADGLRR